MVGTFEQFFEILDPFPQDFGTLENSRRAF